MGPILREECVEFSILDLLKEQLPTSPYGFTLTGGGQDLIVREAFPTAEERSDELKITTLAFGFNQDDGGREMELGSTLTEYLHTMEVWIFAVEPHFGRRVCHAVKDIARKGGDTIGIRDYNQEGNPVIDYLLVRSAKAVHQANNSPRPWDQFVWTVQIKVWDSYVPD